MSYKIEPLSVKQFVTDAQMRLPRFQRKATWTEKQNFELCISIFQDYPIGVVIINKEIDSSWLLDGRQRWSALKEMRSNPNLIYLWAKKYIGFKSSEDVSDLKLKYWGKVEEYLQKDKTEKNEEDEQGNGEAYEDELLEDSFNAVRQRKGLETLLRVILMVHQMKNVKGVPVGAWQRIFDFSKYFYMLNYAPKSEDGRVNPVRLREFLLQLSAEIRDIDQVDFCRYFEDQFPLKEEMSHAFEEEVGRNWTEIKNCIEVIRLSEKTIEESRIGIIQLINVSPLDAQNIFTRINSGGTQLKAEELLSAKPFWNEKVNITDSVLKEEVRRLYSIIGVDTPKDIVKWDLAATLINRIKDKNLFFDHKIEKDGTVNMESVTLGFKLLSSIVLEGMSAKVVNELERSNKIKWDSDIDIIVDELNIVCEILMNSSFFRYLQAWNRPMMRLLQSAIVLEYITIVYKDWKSKGKPRVAGAQMNAVVRDAKVLFDRLVFEYASGGWRGSGDSRMARHIQNWHERIVPVEESAWLNLIEGACSGVYIGQPIALKNITPILYYSHILREIAPMATVNTTYEVDHIIPQAKFVNNLSVNQNLKDSLINIALLPKKDNISKNDRPLEAINEPWLISTIETYTGISKTDFHKYSDVANIGFLKDQRKEMFINLFKTKRKTELSN